MWELEKAWQIAYLFLQAKPGFFANHDLVCRAFSSFDPTKKSVTQYGIAPAAINSDIVQIENAGKVQMPQGRAR